jgi:hypothetical protein
VTLRKVPGALALGLLASLIAHGGLYGSEHSMGGEHHALLLQLAAAGAAGLVLFFGRLGWSGARTAASGSVLAARLNERLPNFGPLAISTALWFGSAEWVEPHHATASWIAVPVVLAAAAWLVHLLCRVLLAVLAGAILAVFGSAFVQRQPSWFRRRNRPLVARRVLRTHRLFARPPPIWSDCRA